MVQSAGNNLQKPSARKKCGCCFLFHPDLQGGEWKTVLVCFCECRTMCKEVHTPVNYAEVVKLSQYPV